MGTDEPDPLEPQPQPQTLAAGELVWAKTKGRHHWWPARLHAPSLSPPLVSSLAADYSDHHRPATAVKPFLAAPDADALAKANPALAFRAAVAQARAAAAAALLEALTCPCARGPLSNPPPDPDQPSEDADTTTNKVVITGVPNLSPREFLDTLGGAAVDPPAVGLLDRARLESWARALEQGWGPDGPGRYQRRSTHDLIDKIDLDVPAGEEDDDDGAAPPEEQEEEDTKVLVPKKKTPKQRTPKEKSTPKQRRRRAASPTEDTESEDKDNVTTQKKEESGAGTGEVSGRRERKKSKYLSPPYTNIGVFADDKLDDSPKKSPPKSSAKKDERTRKKKKALLDEDEDDEEKEVLPPLDNVGAQEVMLLVRSCGLDVSHRKHFPEAAEGFLGLFRSSVFAEGADHVSYKEHKCTGVENDVAKAAGPDVPIAGSASESAKGKRGRKKKDQDGTGDSSLKKKKTDKTSPTVPTTDVPAEASADATDSCASQKKKGEGVLKRGRKKKEQDGTGGSSTKRKKMDKTPPMPTLGHGVPITPAIPIRQVSAQDLMGQVKSVGTTVMGVGVPDQTNTNFLVSKSPISAIMSGGVKSGEEQDLGDGGSVVNTQVNVGGDLSDQSAKQNEEGTVEATMPETDMNVDTLNEDVPARSAQTEVTMPMNVEPLMPAGSAHTEVTVPETGGIQVDMNVECVGVVDVPVGGVQMEAIEVDAHIPPVDTNEEGAVAYVPVGTGLLHAPGGISQPAGGNKDMNSAEVNTIQESYSFLEAMVLETHKTVEEEVAAGTNLVLPQDEYQKVEQASQKMTADGAIFANHPSPAKATTNGTACPDPPNSAQKRRNKKPASYFAHPAELRVKFMDGVILPSKEELLAEFRRFGVLVESECDIIEEDRGARVVFGKSTEAEAAYNKAEIPGMFGQFGPPYATLGLNYLDAITVLPQGKPLIDRADMRKNVENMISSLKNGRSPLNVAPAGGAMPVSESLLAEMQRLLSKLNTTQPAGASSSAPPSS